MTKHGRVSESAVLDVSVRVEGTLREHVERSTAEGAYESVADYVRELIRRDMEAGEGSAFERVRARLHDAFSTPPEEYIELSPEALRRRLLRESRDR